MINKKSQFPPQAIVAILGILILLILAPIFKDLINSANCQNEKGDISNLQGLLSSCKGSNIELQNALNNCLNELNKSENKCNRIVQNLTTQYDLELQENKIFLHFEQRFKIFLLILFFPLSLLSINVGLKLNRKHEKFILLIKVIIWALYLIILTVAYKDFFIKFFGF